MDSNTELRKEVVAKWLAYQIGTHVLGVPFLNVTLAANDLE